jgi:CBS domain-containing protein
VSPLARVRVEEVMARAAPTLPAASPVAEVARRLAAHDPGLVRHHAWPLVDEAGALVGILTRGDLLRALEHSGVDGRPVLEYGTRELTVTYPDEMLEQAIGKMASRGMGRLPVVEREDATRLLGYLGRTGLLDAWLQRVDEEEKRETGVVAEGLRPLGSRLRRMFSGFRRPASSSDASS